jgi:hypothetical protein
MRPSSSSEFTIFLLETSAWTSSNPVTTGRRAPGRAALATTAWSSETTRIAIRPGTTRVHSALPQSSPPDLVDPRRGCRSPCPGRHSSYRYPNRRVRRDYAVARRSVAVRGQSAGQCRHLDSVGPIYAIPFIMASIGYDAPFRSCRNDEPDSSVDLDELDPAVRPGGQAGSPDSR